MKLRSYIYFILLFAAAGISSCKKDNYEAPKSKISGRVVFNGQAVGVRTNFVELELWQHGFDFFSKIPVTVNQDGSFSALVYDGDYKLTRLSGRGPWVDQTDSIDVHVSGNTVVDVPVTSYFVVSNVTYTKNGSNIDAAITVAQGVTTAQIEEVRLFIFKTTILDQARNNGVGVVAGSTVTPGTPVTATVAIPAALAGAGEVYVRAGVKTVGLNELAYSAPQKITL